MASPTDRRRHPDDAGLPASSAPPAGTLDEPAGLDGVLARRVAELVSANRELRLVNARVSHDLRAPLRAIDGLAAALLEDYGARLDGDGCDYLERIRAAAARMGALLEDLLHLSGLALAELRREPLDISATARSIVAELEAAAPGRRVRVEIEDGLTAVGDGRLVHLLLQNLLENAWKFTAPAAEPSVRVRSHRLPDATAFVVEDNGVGFDAAHAGRLFGPFQRLHAAGEFAGNGIGLASAAAIVERHGGWIRAEAPPGGGARFTFTLERAAVETGPRALALAT